MMSNEQELLPDCLYTKQPTLICPSTPTPNHRLYLSNLDDQKFLRFSIKYLYLFPKSIPIENLKSSLSKILVHYYPLAGRLRKVISNNPSSSSALSSLESNNNTNNNDDDYKLEVECNGEGAVFAEAFMDITAQEFLKVYDKMMPNKSLRKLLYRVEALSFLDIPPLVIQVTNLRGGAMILCTGINHCLADGIGTSQFLHAWAHLTINPFVDLPTRPFHSRQVLEPRDPPQINFPHPGFTKTAPNNKLNSQFDLNIFQYLRSQPLAPASITFTHSHILHLKAKLEPSLKCTAFEALASHTWRCWVKSLDFLSPNEVKLLFSMNIRKKLKPEIPEGYYGNGFVLACAKAKAKELLANNLQSVVKLVQHAKSTVTHEYVKSIVDLLGDGKIQTELKASLVISQWSRFGLEDLDFGEGKPLCMGPLTSDIYCLFLPVIGNPNAVRVLVSVPASIIEKFKYYMTEFLGCEENGGAYGNHCGVNCLKMVSV